MQQNEFDREIKRLRDHFGIRHYSNELVEIFWKSFGSYPLSVFRDMVLEGISNRPQSRPPLLDDFKELAARFNVSSSSRWTYFEIDDCMTCGGVGYHYVFRPQGGEAVVACDDCKAGKNLQAAPRGHITWTMVQCRGATYSRPGRGSQHASIHPVILENFSSLDEMQSAMNSKEISILSLIKKVLVEANRGEP